MRMPIEILCCITIGCGSSTEPSSTSDPADQMVETTDRHAHGDRNLTERRMNWKQLCEKWNTDGYESLSEPEQVWVNTRGFIDSVNNGGLVSFFYNSAADRYEDTTIALDELEAIEALDILESFAAFFGDEVPDDIDERNAIINSWAIGSEENKASENVDTVLMPMFDALEEKLNQYLVDHELDPDYGF